MIFLLGEEAIPKRIGYTGLWPKTGAIHANTTITAVYTKDSGIVIPTQPTSPGEIMSGGEGHRPPRFPSPSAGSLQFYTTPTGFPVH